LNIKGNTIPEEKFVFNLLDIYIELCDYHLQLGGFCVEELSPGSSENLGLKRLLKYGNNPGYNLPCGESIVRKFFN